MTEVLRGPCSENRCPRSGMCCCCLHLSTPCSPPGAAPSISCSPASKWMSSGTLFTFPQCWVDVLRTTQFHISFCCVSSSHSASLYVTLCKGVLSLPFVFAGRLSFKYPLCSNGPLEFFFCAFAIRVVNEQH